MPEQSPRVVAGFAIALAHALALYGLAMMQPHEAATLATSAIDVRFVASADAPPPSWRPPRVQITPPHVLTHQPELPPMQSETAPSRAITTPVRTITAAAKPDASMPKRISVVEYLRAPAPRYPPQSRRLREQGVVVLRVVIDERGRACDIEVERSSGYERLDRAAREAVASAAFRPYVEDGAPRRAQVLIPIEFFLGRSSAA